VLAFALVAPLACLARVLERIAAEPGRPLT
jgi:hypothetical protein